MSVSDMDSGVGKSQKREMASNAGKSEEKGEGISRFRKATTCPIPVTPLSCIQP